MSWMWTKGGTLVLLLMVRASLLFSQSDEMRRGEREKDHRLDG